MKQQRFSEEQIAFALRQAESGTTIEEICRKMGISKSASDVSCTRFRRHQVRYFMEMVELPRFVVQVLGNFSSCLSLWCELVRRQVAERRGVPADVAEWIVRLSF